MPKIAIILLAAQDTPEGTERMANALTTTLEFHEAGDAVRLVFDGAGVTWIPRLTDPAEKYSRLFENVRPAVTGACLYCARLRRERRHRAGRCSVRFGVQGPPERPRPHRGRLPSHHVLSSLCDGVVREGRGRPPRSPTLVTTNGTMKFRAHRA